MLILSRLFRLAVCPRLHLVYFLTGFALRRDDLWVFGSWGGRRYADKDINFWLSRGALKANMWSGVPLKTFERDIRQPGNHYYRLFHGSRAERWALLLLMPWRVVRPGILTSTSTATRDILCRAFDVPRIAVAITGLPRNGEALIRIGATARLRTTGS